ncbi:hypothetical protein ACFLS8_02755, partial [Chloroflexota bacterium]
GVPVRMALLAFLLRKRQITVKLDKERKVANPTYTSEHGICCNNVKCVTNQKSELRYLNPEFKIVNCDPLTLRCAYCEHGIEPKFVASKIEGDGKRDNKRYYRANSYQAKRIKPDDLIVFDSEEAAKTYGFYPARPTRGRE